MSQHEEAGPLADIQCLVESFLVLLTHPDEPRVLELPLSETKGAGEEEEEGVRMVSLTANNGRHALQYVRMMEVLSRVHGLLLDSTRVTQRDLYYQVKGPLIAHPASLAAVLQGCCSLLRVPRAGLHVQPMSRGLAAGTFSLLDPTINALEGPTWKDFTPAQLPPQWPGPTPPGCDFFYDTPQGMGPMQPEAHNAPVYHIPGSQAQIQGLFFQGNPHYILVVEKDALFQRLIDDGLPSLLPCLIVTARGFPDVATRAFLHRASAAFPNAPVLGLVDWNPSGVAILRQYRGGGGRRGARTMAEGRQYGVPRLRYLGVRSHHIGLDGVRSVEDLGRVPGGESLLRGLQELTPRDRALLRGLRSDPEMLQLGGWLHEMEVMERLGRKAEAELAYECHGGTGRFTDFVQRAMLRHDYV